MGELKIKRIFSGSDGKKLMWLIIVGAVGLALILFGSLSGGGKKKTQNLSND